MHLKTNIFRNEESSINNKYFGLYKYSLGAGKCYP